ncbi:MAG: hypothetical protein SF162_04600 [bacterium]|nr:hypothetical protein [bacterium]
MKRFSRLTVFSLLVLLTVGMFSAVTAQESASGVGRIAYIDSGYNLHIWDAATQQDRPVTTDAIVTQNAARIYQYPTWATDGRLAYFASTFDSTGNGMLEVYIASGTGEAGTVRYSSETEAITYAYWSPGPCAAGENCRQLAALLSDSQAGAFVVRLIADGGAEQPIQTAGTGAPFYFGWSSDGERMVWHRNNASVEVFDVRQGEVTATLSTSPGLFAAPSFAPDGSALFVGRDGEIDQLRIAAADGTESSYPLDGRAGATFAWSPDGTRIAFAAPAGRISVIDTATGAVIAQSPEDEQPFAYFWSPDGRKIAYLTVLTTAAPDAPAPIPNSGLSAKRRPPAQDSFNGIVWNVLDLEAQTVAQSPAFFPTREFVYLLSYFDQFALSHRVWSPDSRAITYSRFDDGQRAEVMVWDISADQPFALAEGVFSVWSFDE